MVAATGTKELTLKFRGREAVRRELKHQLDRHAALGRLVAERRAQMHRRDHAVADGPAVEPGVLGRIDQRKAAPTLSKVDVVALAHGLELVLQLHFTPKPRAPTSPMSITAVKSALRTAKSAFCSGDMTRRMYDSSVKLA